MPIALRGESGLTRYADVAMLVSMYRDDLLVTTLRDRYLMPLSRHRDGGSVLRETLRAYFGAARNVSSAAAVLGVSRQTVTNRLSTVERWLGSPLHTCATEIDTALRLEDLGYLTVPTALARGSA